MKRAFTRVSVKLKRRLDGVKPLELEPMALILHGLFDAFVADCRGRGCAHPSLTRLALRFCTFNYCLSNRESGREVPRL